MDANIPTSNTYQQVRIAAIKEEVTGVKTFTLQPLQGDIIYTPGQFLTFAFTHHHKEERRSFSISSTPALQQQQLAITLKRIENGAFSRLLIDRAQVDDVLNTTGAAGLFTLPADVAARKQLFFLAAGIGITPIFSLLKTALLLYPLLNVVLIYSNRTREETVFYEELIALREQFSQRFKIEFLFSSSFDLARARLSKWLLPKLIEEYGLLPKEDICYYICGPFTYMRMAIITLEEQGVPAANIKKENFDTVVQLPHISPPDRSTQKVQLHLQSNNYIFEVKYPKSILQAAKELAIPISYSCETGQCGSCVAICRTGKVWMSYNQVLTDADLAAQKILTCTGHPVGGDITLEIQ